LCGADHPVLEKCAGLHLILPKRLYRLWVRVEPFIGKLKRLERVAMQCGKTAANFVALACVFVVVKSVHSA